MSPEPSERVTPREAAPTGGLVTWNTLPVITQDRADAADAAPTTQVRPCRCDDCVMATIRRADMFVDLKDDPRENGPSMVDERTTLVEFLRCVRLSLELKCSGLDAEAL